MVRNKQTCMPTETHNPDKHTHAPPETRQNLFSLWYHPWLDRSVWTSKLIMYYPRVWLPQLQDQHIIKQLQAVLPVQQLPHLRKRWENASHCDCVWPVNLPSASGALAAPYSSPYTVMCPVGASLDGMRAHWAAPWPGHCQEQLLGASAPGVHCGYSIGGNI